MRAQVINSHRELMTIIAANHIQDLSSPADGISGGFYLVSRLQSDSCQINPPETGEKIYC